ncbi:MAG: LamG domain-containing protein, partial [Planctomycetes bacterium]|nr:LamG domain-containing protein [Planctomycetota bacterium]
MIRERFTACIIFIITGLICTSHSYGQVDAKSVVGYWLFDEASGNVARDSSGHGYDADLKENPVWVEGKFGHAIEFQGENYLEIRNSSQNLPFGGSDPFTVTAWVKNQGGGTIIGKFNGGIIGAYILTISGGGTVSFHREVDPWSFSGSMALLDDDFGHVAVTYDGAEMKIYVNGEFDSSQERGPQNTDTVTPVLIGARFTNDVPSEFFNGVLDEVALFNVALTEQQIRDVMLGLSFPKAFDPNPADGAFHEDTWVSLSWSPGDSAVSHDVYLGESFDDVFGATHDSALYRGNQASTFYTAGFPGFPYPEGLIPGTTYYWRIDEINDLNPNSPWRGDVWRFKIPPKTAYAPDPADAAEQVVPNIILSWTAGFGSKLHTVYFGDNFDDVSNAAGGLPQGTTDFTPGLLKMAQTYYWRVDEFDIIETYKGDVWSFTTQGAVGNPDPASGAEGVTQTPVLTWTPGVFGASHEVYFGSDKEAVENADTSSPEYKGSGGLGSESYDPGQLEWNTTYYWRVDEANNANADSPWTGPLWNFATADFLIIDDFESYNDLDESEPGSNRIYLAWVDGFDNPSVNGSVVGYANPPFAEQTIVHGGNQSMPFAYDNAVGKSEATYVLTSNRDWTFKGINTLTIWFRGESGNAAENLYVALNGNAVVNHDDSNAAQIRYWTEWNIELQAFADQGVNLANVTSITLGLGDKNNPVAGGAGIMYFDDIRLY